jgi:cell division protein FtsW
MEWLKKLAFPLYLLALLFLVLPLVPGLGMELNGANRWISTPWFSLQPVELFKFAFINFYAAFLAKEIKLTTFLFFLFLPALILLLQPDFGSLMIIVAVALILYFLAGGELKFLAIISLTALFLAVTFIISSPYRRERLTTFLHPELDPSGNSYHIHQITLALGNGSWFGRGIGNSQQKYAYVPEASSDSIFAIIAEELGFLGSSLIIILLASYFVAANAMFPAKKVGKEKNQYQYLLFYGILAWIAVQIFFNLAAVVVILPLSGMPLPFFSQGGSSLLSLFFASGILLNIANHPD